MADGDEQKRTELEREAYERIRHEFEGDRELTDYDLTDHLELLYDIDPENDKGYTLKVTVEAVLYS